MLWSCYLNRFSFAVFHWIKHLSFPCFKSSKHTEDKIQSKEWMAVDSTRESPLRALLKWWNPFILNIYFMFSLVQKIIFVKYSFHVFSSVGGWTSENMSVREENDKVERSRHWNLRSCGYSSANVCILQSGYCKQVIWTQNPWAEWNQRRWSYSFCVIVQSADFVLKINVI